MTEMEMEPPVELSEEEVQLAERHRGYIREIDQAMGKAYGWGGFAVIVVMSLLGAVGWLFGMLFQPSLWIFGITAALATLFMARKKIYSRRDQLKRQVESYCEVNEVTVELLRSYYESEQMYPFFTGIFEARPGQRAQGQPAAES